MPQSDSSTSFSFDALPASLKAQRRWLLWRFVERDGKRQKVPVGERGVPVNATDPANWRTFDEAVAAFARARVRGAVDGVGVALGDGLCGVDLDGVRTDDGRLTAAAADIVATLASYAEVSVSGAGVHVLVSGTLPPGCRHRAPLPGGGHIEAYDGGRFFTVSGRRLAEAPAAVREAREALAEVCRRYGLLPPATPVPAGAAQVGDDGDVDVLLVARAVRADTHFARLWFGDTSGYPSQSEADLALCVRLLELVGGDVRRADRLFRRSGLARPKWDERHRGDGATYGALTLQRALACYRDRLQEPVLRASRDGTGPLPADHAAVAWDPPLPLDPPPLPAFPLDVLPPTLADFVRGVAEARQLPADVPGTLVLAVLAAAAQRIATVTVRDGWTEPLSLYTASVLPSGERKTPAYADVAAPLVTWEARKSRDLEPVIAAAAARKAILEQRLRHAEARAAKATGAEAEEALAEAEALARELATFVVPARPRLVADDATPEAVARLLAEHGGRVAVFSDEGDLFDIIRGRYGNGPNLGVYLKAHVGSPIRVDRVGRASLYVLRPAISVGVAVQPAVLFGLHHDPHLRGRGLLARFLYAWPHSLVGRRLPDPPPIPTTVRARYHTLVTALLDRLTAWAEATEPVAPHGDRDTGGAGEADQAPVCLRLSDDAYRQLVQFQAELEPHLGPDGELAPLADWANKLVGTVVRLAALLHLADWVEAGAGGDPAERAVDADTVGRAVTLGRYYLAHARRAFTAMGTDPHLDDARYLWHRIAADGHDAYSRRDLLRLAQRFATVADLDPPLRVLIAYGYLRELPAPTPTPAGGRPPGPFYHVNPRARRGGRVLSVLSGSSGGSAPAARGDVEGDAANVPDKTDTTGTPPWGEDPTPGTCAVPDKTDTTDAPRRGGGDDAREEPYQPDTTDKTPVHREVLDL